MLEIKHFAHFQLLHFFRFFQQCYSKLIQ